jgi:hypothetical protein
MNKHYTYPTDDPNPSDTNTELSLKIYLLNSIKFGNTTSEATQH